MNEDMIRKQMDLYYQATRIPLCLFDRQNMLKKSSHPTQDFNLDETKVEAKFTDYEAGMAYARQTGKLSAYGGLHSPRHTRKPDIHFAFLSSMPFTARHASL